MRSAIIALAAIPAFASAQSASASPTGMIIGAVIPIGQPCTPGGTMCALGGSCYAVNSMQQPICGNFQAQCTSNQQCAFNTCNGGFCNGVLPSSASTPTPTVSPTSTPIGAVVPVGSPCTPGGTMCALGSQCYAVNSMQQTICGNFQAQCTSNQQCAFNSCYNGLCGGFFSTASSMPVASSTKVSQASSSVAASSSAAAISSSPAGNMTMTLQPSQPTTGSSTTKTSPPAFTGAASIANVAGGAIAMVLGSLAWAL